jgi:hypothetical protein
MARSLARSSSAFAVDQGGMVGLVSVSNIRDLIRLLSRLNVERPTRVCSVHRGPRACSWRLCCSSCVGK